MVWEKALAQDGDEDEPCWGKCEVEVEAEPVRAAPAAVFDLATVLNQLVPEEHGLLQHHW